MNARMAPADLARPVDVEGRTATVGSASSSVRKSCSPASFETAYVQRASPTEPMVVTFLARVHGVRAEHLARGVVDEAFDGRLWLRERAGLECVVGADEVHAHGADGAREHGVDARDAGAVDDVRRARRQLSHRLEVEHARPSWRGSGWSSSSVPPSVSRWRLSTATTTLSSTSRRAERRSDEAGAARDEDALPGERYAARCNGARFAWARRSRLLWRRGREDGALRRRGPAPAARDPAWARELGLRVVAVDRNADALRLEADAGETVDFRDVGVIDVARGATPWTARSRCPPTGLCRWRPRWRPRSASRASGDVAHLMTHKIMRAGGSPTPVCRSCGSPRCECWPRRVRPSRPSACRPCSSRPTPAGSAVFLLEQLDDIDVHLHAALAESAGGEAIVERYHEGLELNGLVLARDGEVILLTPGPAAPPGIGFGVG